MHPTTVILALLAATASALPAAAADAQDSGLDERDMINTVLYKRDDVLTPADLALAAEHGADVTKMYRHSLLQYPDGNNITIWVNNNFQEGDPLEKRQTARLGGGVPFRNVGGADQILCNPVVMPDSITRPESAFTGGANAMATWGSRTAGYFEFSPGCCSSWLDMVIAGSNNGANARFSGRWYRASSGSTRVGAGDVGQVAAYSVRQFQRNWGNGWRVASEGFLSCSPGSISFELKRTDRII